MKRFAKTAPIGTQPLVNALGHRSSCRASRRNDCGRERRAEAAETGDDLVEDQQDAVTVADLAQPF
jgi:hypothetical protein